VKTPGGRNKTTGIFTQKEGKRVRVQETITFSEKSEYSRANPNIPQSTYECQRRKEDGLGTFLKGIKTTKEDKEAIPISE